jgi:hypothetical protein
VYLKNPGVQTTVQRIRTDDPRTKIEKLAHVTNYIFDRGYLLPKFRSSIYWQTACGKTVKEDVSIMEALEFGEGSSEDRPLRLVVGKLDHTSSPSLLAHAIADIDHYHGKNPFDPKCHCCP